MIFMPFSYSLAYGLIAGILCYVLINTSSWAIGLVSGGRWLPPDYDDREYWCRKYHLLLLSVPIVLTHIDQSFLMRATNVLGCKYPHMPYRFKSHRLIWYSRFRAFMGERHFWKNEEQDSFELASTECQFETTVQGRKV